LISLAKKFGGLYWPSKIMNPEFLYDKDFSELDEEELKNFESIVNVYNWLRVEVKTVFLQDAGSMTLSTTKLIEVMSYLKQVFPGLGRITCYARAKSLAKKTQKN